MHPWKARFSVAFIMIILAFVGLIVTDIHRDRAWEYWRLMAVVFAALCIGLSVYLRKKQAISAVSIWHEIVHWGGLGAAIYLVSFLVGLGIMGRFEAALMVLTLLALTTFLAGVYTEISFVMIGILLGCFVAGIAYIEEYLYGILLPLMVVAAGVLVYMFKTRT
ncbi:MAG: hypothetical protein KBC64_03810 [Simkaniaceae bacterium]|nr:hypothetical protein [Simkaniaceae bacterium]